jgi:hypothetical protein
MDSEPITVEFPLRGEWEAENTPAERVPSHGTHLLGQTYAYDFVRIDRQAKGMKFFHGSFLKYILFGVRLEQCFGWAAPFFSPFAGTVVTAKDGWPERRRLHLFRDLAIVLKNAFTFDPARAPDLRPVLGNHIILKKADEDIYAFFAHARTGSIRIREGDTVDSGQQLGEVGHSGNSTAPHLHFHLMDGPNILEAKGLPCRFRQYESLQADKWTTITNGLPGKREFVRYAT